MKKNRIIVLLLVLAVMCTFAFGCGGTEEPVTYTITVTSGTADKTTAKAGEEITLTPNAASEGKEFSYWTVNGENITGNKFTMPEENVTAVAIYVKIDYTVSVTGGTANKTTAQMGDTVTLTPGSAPSGKQFSHWTVDGTKIDGNTFIMKAANATVVAIYVNQKYTVSVTGGSANVTSAEQGDTVTLTPGAAPAGQEFSHWTVDGTRIDGNTFTMSNKSVIVVAIYSKIDYTVSVTGGTADKTTAQMGDTVTLTPGVDPADKVFSGWKVNNSAISGNTFTMPAANVTVEAVYIDLVRKIATPDNSANKLFFPENATTPCPVAIDRSGSTMFTNLTDYVLMYIYDSSTATNALGSFKLIRDPAMDGKMNAGVITSMDGTLSIPFNGSPTNYYFDGGQWNNFFNIVRYELGYIYSEGQTYYFAAQVIAITDTVNEGGHDITYTDSDISAIGTVGIAKDATKLTDRYTLTVVDGLIDGTHTSIEAGYGVSVVLSTEAIDGYTFTGWYAVDNDGDTYGEAVSFALTFTYSVTKTVKLKAVFIEDSEVVKTPIATPNNSESKLIYKEPSGAIAFDRAGSTMFTLEAEYVIFYIYDAADAETALGSFKIRTEYGKDADGGSAIVGWVESMDDVKSEYIIRGNAGGYYTINDGVDKLFSIINYAIGYSYSAGRTYYFAAQVIAKDSSIFADSEISEVGGTGFAKDGSKGTEVYTVTLLDGLIDDALTTVNAGYGATITLTAVMPEDKDTFFGWTVITFGEGDVEVRGTVLSTNLTYTMLVTSTITLRPIFINIDDFDGEILPAPDNTDDAMIKFSGALIEYDRQKDNDDKITAFVVGVDYLLCHIYDSAEDGAEAVGSFKIIFVGDVAYLSKIDGSETFALSGEAGNLYSNSGNAHNLIKSCITGYSNSVAYYYAFQAIADGSGLYLNSEIGPIGRGWIAI